jgi:hypothetical protein
MKLKIGNQKLEWNHHAKYLGITLNYNLGFNKHIKNILQKARGAWTALYPTLNHNSALPLHTRLAIYKIYLRPNVLYAATIWRHLIGHYMWSKIEAFQNKTLRIITGAHYSVSSLNFLNSTNIPPFKEEALSIAKTFQHRLSTSKFPHLSRLAKPTNNIIKHPIQSEKAQPGALNRPQAAQPKQITNCI